MLKSSSEYLQALRKGNYLLFLEWLRFIAAHYKALEKSSENLGAENIVDLLIFEWLNNGYREEDAKLVALLYKLNEMKPNLLSADLNYAVVTIYMVVLQCMIYHSTNAHLKFLSSSPKTAKEVISFMNANAIAPTLLESSLAEQQTHFLTWVEEVTDEEISRVVGQISPILQLRRTATNYVDSLEKSDCIRQATSDSDLDSSRLSVVRRLLQYLNEQVELTEAVDKKIKEYVAAIRELRPQPFEEEYLIKIVPSNLADNTWRLIAKIGYFFSSLALPAEPAVADEAPKSTIPSNGTKP